MKVSCGILIKNEFDELLMGHVTGNSFFDIPKGGLDEGESYLACALRECEEETSIKLNESQLKDLGLHKYNKEKNLYLFEVNVKKDEIKLESLVCHSMFEHRYTKKMVPEVDGFSWVNVNDVDQFCAKSMAALLKKLYVENMQKNNLKNGL